MADWYKLLGLRLQLHEAEHVLVSLYGDTPQLLAYFQAKKTLLGAVVQYVAFDGYNSVAWHNQLGAGSRFADPDRELDVFADAELGGYALLGADLCILCRPTAGRRRARAWAGLEGHDVFIGFARLLRPATYQELGGDSADGSGGGPEDFPGFTASHHPVSVEYGATPAVTHDGPAGVLERFGPLEAFYPLL